MRDHMAASGWNAEFALKPLAAVLAVDDDGVSAAVGAAQAGDLPRAWLTRNNIVGGDHERAVARQQRGSDLRQRQPLEVHDVSLPCGAAVAEHLGNLCCEPRSRAQLRARLPAQHAPEALVNAISVSNGNGAVAERPTTERYVRARACQRSAKRTVVRRRVSRRVDDMNTH